MGKKKNAGLQAKLSKFFTKRRIIAIIIIFILYRFIFSFKTVKPPATCKYVKPTPQQQYIEKEGEILLQQQTRVKHAFQHAYRNYKKNAFGFDELKPISRTNHDEWIGMGLTIVDSIDTMYIMGLQEEYREARDWIENNLHFDEMTQYVSLFETTIRVVGGLLSIYQLTNDVMFLQKASDLGNRLVNGFETDSGIPHHTVRVKDGAHQSTLFDREVIFLSEAGSLQMEYLTLSHETDNPEYGKKAMRVFEILNEMEKHNGLYPIHINPKTKEFQKETTWRERWSNLWDPKEHYYTLGGKGDSFYEYLLKVWIMTGKKDETTRKMYEEATAAVIDQLMFYSEPSRLLYFSEKRGNKMTHHMEHLACFLGGMFALGAYHDAVSNKTHHMKIAEEITATCHESYIRTISGLGPDSFSFSASFSGGGDFCPEGLNYYLRPETVESYYILYKITGDIKYQEWGWQAFQAIEKHCRLPEGYSGVKDVTKENSEHDDLQQSFFLAETLKYLYLLFSPSLSSSPLSSGSVSLSLDEWVFNTEAHPLRVYDT